MIASDVVIPAQNLFGDSNGIIAIDALAISAVNEAMDEVARETLMFTGTINTTAAACANGLDLSATADFILAKRVTYGGAPLALLEQESLDRLNISTINLTIPKGFYIDGFTFRLFPVPLATDTTAVIISYAKFPTHIVALSGQVPIPEVWRNDLINYVTMRFHERNENWQAYNIYNTKWSAALSNRKYEGTGREDTYRVVGIDYADFDSEYIL